MIIRFWTVEFSTNSFLSDMMYLLQYILSNALQMQNSGAWGMEGDYKEMHRMISSENLEI